jgi:hypothetical protein
MSVMVIVHVTNPRTAVTPEAGPKVLLQFCTITQRDMRYFFTEHHFTVKHFYIVTFFYVNRAASWSIAKKSPVHHFQCDKSK